MKRMVPAAALAILIHIGILWLFEHVMTGKTEILPPASKTVTVTMSYRPPPKKPVKKPTAIKKIPKPTPLKPIPEKSDTPEKPEKKPATEDEPEENNVNTIKEDPESATHGESIANMTTPIEAVPLYNINPPPRYPKAAIKRGYQGTVELMVLVNKNGTVSDVWLFESSGYSMLDQAALDAVKNWSFTPGKRGSQKIEMWVRVPVRFQLQ